MGDEEGADAVAYANVESVLLIFEAVSCKHHVIILNQSKFVEHQRDVHNNNRDTNRNHCLETILLQNNP